MDCDANDFQSQSQNQQLADEGSTKFSPVLQPFGLSKFDFDDNLQGHPRFDSLVESEVFLGIGNSIDSQWIEDYSRGNGATEFTTCASESCSILRHNNVWSEATSSESVEMLLKSVGLEEAMPRQPAIQPSNSSEPCSTITQMEPNLTDDTGIISDKADTSKGESPSHLDEISPSYTVEKAVKEHQTSEKVVLQTWNGTSSVENLIKEDLSIRSESLGSPMIINIYADGKDVIAHGKSDKSQHLSDLEIQEINASASMEIVVTNYDRTENMAVLDHENTVDDVPPSESQNDTKSGPLTITEEACENIEYLEETTACDVQFTADTFVSDHLTEACMEEGNDMRINAALESLDAPPTASLDIQFVDELAEGASVLTTALPKLVENVVLNQDVGVGGLSEGKENRSPSLSGSIDDPGKPDQDVGVGSTVAEVPSGFEQPTDSSEQKLLLAADTSADNADELDQDPFPVEVKLPAPSAVAVKPKEEVLRNDVFRDPVGQVNREQVATEKSTLAVASAEETLGPLEFNQGPASLAGKDGLGGFTNSEVPEKSSESALESSARDNVANAEMDTPSSLLPGSVLPSELPSHHTPEVDHEPCLTCTDVADDAAGESRHVSEMIEAAIHSPQIVDTGKEVIDKSGSTAGKGEDIFAILEKPDEVSVEGKSSMDPRNICVSPALPSIDHSNSSKANISSPIVISSMEVSKKEISREQTKKSIDQKPLPDIDMPNMKETEIFKDDKSFSFDVTSLDKRDLTKNWQPFSSASDPKATQGSTIPALLQMENQGLMLNNVGSPPKPVKETSRRRKKDSSEHKPRRASRKGAAKESGKKSSSVKDSAASKQIETVDKLSPHSVTLPGAHQLLPSGELQHHRQIDFTTAKSFGVLTATTSGLSDLNSLAFGHVVFCQPFTDLQQVQLRAQIFVYGSLISKLVPEEVHMMSAFGGPDGGRGMWENAWRVCRERALGQASLPAILETPVKSRAGEVIFDQVTNHGTRQAAVSSSPAVRSNSKGTASPAINLVQPLGSPVWSFSTQSFDASQLGALPKGAIQPAFSTFHSNQSPPVANFFGPSSSWMSQTPFCSPWSVSAQTSMQEPGTRVPLLPVTESVKPAPVLESSVSVSSSTVGLPSVPAGLLPSASTAVDPKKAAILPGLPSSESKSRKRKKLSTSADPGQISSHQSQIQPSPIPSPVGPHSVTYPSIGLHSAIFSPASTSGFLMETCIDKHVPKSPSFSFGDPGLQELDKSKSALSEESIVKVREARKQAEDAAALACTAMNHSQAIWDQLNKHKNSGNVATAEVKLASAAAAISAAASVAKAAAAAASVASKAALQAKLMADEAMNPSRSNCHSSHGDCSSIVGGKDASLSILRGDTATNFSNSTISEARDAVRKKIEAASAASLQAENLDALVKAAELAAQAIAKAGKVVAMGDPLPLNVLAEAGPDGFWELAYPKSSSELHVAKVGDVTVAITDSSRRMAELKHDKGTLGRSMNDTLGLENSGFGKKGGKVSDTGNEGNLLTELQHRPDNTHNDVYGAVETSRQNSIKVGSQVEVFKSGEGFKSSWFSANVLSLKDGKAFVCYSEIPSNEGSGKLEEWVDLECVADEPPKLRIAHPMTVMKFEGKRKRRRAAMGVFTCSVGDKVDAWIKDGWQEGVVTDKDKDGTTVTVHFPVYGDTSVVRAWHLRPSLIWKNGEWVEWTSTVGNLDKCLEGDTPQEKRAKLGTPGPVPGEKDKETKEIHHLVEKEKPPQEGSLKLTSEEKVFNIGKRAADGKKDPARTRTGSRKESSRVVIGVPKPGKKRKFMEVSKHLVGNQTKKTNELKDSAKLASYLIPQVGGPRGWKPFSRGDTKDKGIGDSKMKVLRSGRLQNAPGRTLPPKSNLAAANSSEGPQRGNADHDGFKRNNASEFKPLSESEDAASEGHADPVTSSDTGSFKTSMATVRTAWVTKGRVPSGKVAKGEENKALTSDPSKSAADGSEPRRSSRRIQPTSRLLEGLQSSITITKFPSALHDRGHKVSSKGAAKGKNNG